MKPASSLCCSEGNKPLQVVIYIAETVIGHHDTLGDMGQLVFLRHGDTTVQLDALFAHQTAHSANQVLVAEMLRSRTPRSASR